MDIDIFQNFYKNKKVLVTGHSGFKGSWLSLWLHQLGAKVYGLSKNILTVPSFNEILKNKKVFQKQFFFDVNDMEELTNTIKTVKPDLIFHLAAQALVSVSYEDPYDTIKSNVLGTTSLLEVLRLYENDCTAVVITSDKVYKNVEQLWGYKENDLIGGSDIYSGSKGAADIIINSYYKSFFSNKNKNINLVSTRAGNVIGGGDWSKDRLIVDAIKSWNKNEKLKIRFPKATRPWQHVLEPISGYLSLGHSAHYKNNLGEAFNFGPKNDSVFSVETLIYKLSNLWFEDNDKHYEIIGSDFKESRLLSLNCEKASNLLGWKPILDFDLTLKFTVSWYKAFYAKKNMYDFSLRQISEFVQKHKQKS